jgi:hypothetical protein
VEGVCRLVGRRAREWAQSVRTVEELADETGVDILRGHRRPMIVIKAEKQDRARYCPTPENITAESITMCHTMPSHAITERRVGSEIMTQDGWQRVAS